MFYKTCPNCGKTFTTTRNERKFCSRSCVSSFYTRSRWTEDESVFQGLSLTPDEAYLIGLIYTDGSLTFDKHSGRWRITIASKDKVLMEQLRARMTPSKKLYRNRGCYYIVTNNRNDINFLVSIGLHANKSYTIQVPWLPRHLQSHFVRGVFDGDGSVFRSKTTFKGKTYNYIGVTIKRLPKTAKYRFFVLFHIA